MHRRIQSICRKSKIQSFAKIGNSTKPLTILAKQLILDVWQFSEYVYKVRTLSQYEIVSFEIKSQVTNVPQA